MWYNKTNYACVFMVVDYENQHRNKLSSSYLTNFYARQKGKRYNNNNNVGCLLVNQRRRRKLWRDEGVDGGT